MLSALLQFFYHLRFRKDDCCSLCFLPATQKLGYITRVSTKVQKFISREINVHGKMMTVGGEEEESVGRIVEYNVPMPPRPVKMRKKPDEGDPESSSAPPNPEVILII